MIADWRDSGKVTIGVLPDDVLLSVFDCYVGEATDVEGWRTLVYVCRRWKNVVLGSPRRLHLRIALTNKSHVREKLDAWPCLPIVISGYCDSMTCLDNIKAALEHGNRICQIELMINSRQLPINGVFAALEKPFPALTDLDLSPWPVPSISGYPDPLKFLGGSSHLRSLSLGAIAIPQFPSLLATSTHLNDLHLHDIPIYGHLTPDAMVAALSALTNLKTLSLRFSPGQSHADLGNKKSQHTLQRSVIPSLLSFDFEGVSEYLEALASRIDTPVLNRLGITIFRRPTFDTTQLLLLLGRIPKMQEIDKARVKLAYPEVWAEFSSSDLGRLRLGISSNEPQRHFPCLTRFLGLPFNPLPTLESLRIVACPRLQQYRWDCIENAKWLELLRPFVAVKNLYLSKEVAPRIALALEELVGEGAIEVFPTLQNVFLEDPPPAGAVYSAATSMTRFANARQLSGHPIHISVSR
jgi:hypothetical protein